MTQLTAELRAEIEGLVAVSRKGGYAAACADLAHGVLELHTANEDKSDDWRDGYATGLQAMMDILQRNLVQIALNNP